MSQLVFERRHVVDGRIATRRDATRRLERLEDLAAVVAIDRVASDPVQVEQRLDGLWAQQVVSVVGLQGTNDGKWLGRAMTRWRRVIAAY